MADNKISLPSGTGGLTRYFDEYTSKLQFGPGVVIVLVIIVIIVEILLHIFGSAGFNI
ncbi:preprotein translocase subunit Sec61beta [Candidatus Woesearchaeota archaeon]|nr:preprotein translocase subunit Sec61beta [Candidatus Woesearchaeota archaeon]